MIFTTFHNRNCKISTKLVLKLSIKKGTFELSLQTLFAALNFQEIFTKRQRIYHSTGYKLKSVCGCKFW